MIRQWWPGSASHDGVRRGQQNAPVSAAWWLVVGLGNPEAEYGGTRHNIGADAVRLLAQQLGGTMAPNKRARGEVAELRLGDNRVVAYVPSSYMNSSGGPVQAAAAWYKVDPDRIIVCHDDLDIALGAVKVKRGGSSAGHNGLKDLERALGTPDYLRVRIGIGRPAGRTPARTYVLSRFSEREHDDVVAALERSVDAVGSLVRDGLDQTQNVFHARD